MVFSIYIYPSPTATVIYMEIPGLEKYCTGRYGRIGVYIVNRMFMCITLTINVIPVGHREVYRRPPPQQRPVFTFPLGDGGSTNFKMRVGSNANLSVFRYQHVGIPNAKFLLGV